MTLEEKIKDTRKQLNDPKISAPRKRDLTKYLWRLQNEQRKNRGLHI